MARIYKHETTLKKQSSMLKKEAGLLEYISKAELIIGILLTVSGIILLISGNGYIMLSIGIVLLFLGAAHRSKKNEDVVNKIRFDAGKRGENYVLKILTSRLPDEYYILNDVDVKAGRNTSQMDHVVLGPNGIFVIETKNYTGLLEGDASDSKLKQTKKTKDGKTYVNYLSNPVSQNEHHLRVFKKYLMNNNIHEELVSIVVFTNKWADIKIRNVNVPVLKPYQLPNKILKWNTEKKLSQETIDKLLNLLS